MTSPFSFALLSIVLTIPTEGGEDLQNVIHVGRAIVVQVCTANALQPKSANSKRMSATETNPSWFKSSGQRFGRLRLHQ